ncbi:MAG: hypothetical protein KC635_12900, partial [Myxococcales bacterium]|nr:hypothetical protein [Myxococcales bacterium]
PAPTNLPDTELGWLAIRHRGQTAWMDVAVVGRPAEQSWRLVAGTYEVQYRRTAAHQWRAGILTPENEETVIGTVVVPVGGGVVPLDVRAGTVTFTARMGGQPVPTNLPQSEQGWLSMRHEGATAWMDLGPVGGELIGPDWRLVAGRYDVRYRHGASYEWREGIVLPENPETVFATVEVKEAGGVVAIPMSALDLTFAVRLNGQPAPTTLPETDQGFMDLTHAGATEAMRVELAGAAPTGWAWRLLAGDYRVSYAVTTGYRWHEGILTPENGET